MTDDATARVAARLIELDDLTPGEPVVVGCSGGADSLALLVLARARDLDVHAVYVDHGLRATTDHDATTVAGAAERFGAAFAVERVAVDDGASLEARARDARYAALERARARVNAQAVLVAHTRDDQAETVLLNVLRGSGVAGLAGMPTRRAFLRRPLLHVRRAETRELCARLQLTPVHDPMNDELRHRRVWLRRDVIPRLEAGADRDLVEVLARQAAVLRDDADALDALAAERATDDVKSIAAMPVALARRVVRRWLGAPPPSLATVDAVLSVARGARVATEIPGGDRVQRVGGRLVRVPSTTEKSPSEVRLALPGRARCGDFVVEAWIEHGPPAAWPDGRWSAVCDADRLPEEVVLRAGSPTPELVAERSVWVVGYRVDRHVRTSAGTRRYLWLRAEPAATAATD